MFNQAFLGKLESPEMRAAAQHISILFRGYLDGIVQRSQLGGRIGEHKTFPSFSPLERTGKKSCRHGCPIAQTPDGTQDAYADYCSGFFTGKYLFASWRKDKNLGVCPLLTAVASPPITDDPSRPIYRGSKKVKKGSSSSLLPPFSYPPPTL